MWRKAVVTIAVLVVLPASAGAAAACAPAPPPPGSSEVSSPGVDTPAGMLHARGGSNGGAHAGVTFSSSFTVSYLRLGNSYLFVDGSPDRIRVYGVGEGWVQNPANANQYVSGMEFLIEATPTGLQPCAKTRPSP